MLPCHQDSTTPSIIIFLIFFLSQRQRKSFNGKILYHISVAHTCTHIHCAAWKIVHTRTLYTHTYTVYTHTYFLRCLIHPSSSRCSLSLRCLYSCVTPGLRLTSSNRWVTHRALGHYSVFSRIQSCLLAHFGAPAHILNIISDIWLPTCSYSVCGCSCMGV